MAVNTDLAATVLDVTGAKPTRSIDGRSLTRSPSEPRGEPGARCSTRSFAREPAATSSRTAPRRPSARRRARARVPSYRAVRTSRWLWVEYSDRSRELYDRVRDPQELQSRHADRRYAALALLSHKALTRLATCAASVPHDQAVPGIPAANRR